MVLLTFDIIRVRYYLELTSPSGKKRDHKLNDQL
jgi:hypothetical protein